MLGENEGPPHDKRSRKDVQPAWYRAIFSPPPQCSGSYATLTAAHPSTVGMFARVEPLPIPIALAVPGRGGCDGTVTASQLRQLYATLCSTCVAREEVMQLDLLARVLASLSGPAAGSAVANDAAAASADAAAKAATGLAKPPAMDADELEYDDYYDEPGNGGAASSDTFWSKGTGFGVGGTGVEWNRDEWDIQKAALADHDEAAFKCVTKTIELITRVPIEKEAGDAIAKTLATSALATLLGDLMATDSMVDIALHRTLYQAAVNVVQIVAQNEQLFRAFEEHERNAAIADALLKTMRSFDRIITQDADRPVLEAYRRASGLIRQLRPDAPVAVGQCGAVLAAPLDYCGLLGPGQFGEAKFGDAHHYKATAASAGPPPAACMERIVQELGSLATSLPLHEGSSIFLRYDPDRMNLMKAMITGPEGTPYSAGCFEFDMYFPSEFPTVPPLVNLMTTGNGAVRFNPNLYNNGKVCLSILGTWPGRPEEQWGPHCTILQVLTSIQSLVLVDEPYYNEPGYERTRGTDRGDKMNRDYTRVCQKDCLKWAMLEQITSPSPAFAKVTAAHFLQKREHVIDQCTKWELAAMAERHRDLVKKAEAAFEAEAQLVRDANAAAKAEAAAAAAEAAAAAAKGPTPAEAAVLLEDAVETVKGKKGKAKKKAKSKLKACKALLSKPKAVLVVPAAAAPAIAQAAIAQVPAPGPFTKSVELIALEEAINKLELAGVPSFDDAESDDEDYADAVEPST